MIETSTQTTQEVPLVEPEVVVVAQEGNTGKDKKKKKVDLNYFQQSIKGIISYFLILFITLLKY